MSVIFFFVIGICMICIFAYLVKSIIVLLFLFIVLFSLAFQLRSQLRHLFHLPGNYCSDCCLSFCCPCCVIAQVY